MRVAVHVMLVAFLRVEPVATKRTHRVMRCLMSLKRSASRGLIAPLRRSRKTRMSPEKKFCT